jgi:hypothetical protein
MCVGDDQIDYECGKSKTNKHDQRVGLVNIHACPINHLSLFSLLLLFSFAFSEWNLIGSR